MGIRCADHVAPLYPQKLALTSPTGGGRSVGIVLSRTKATESSYTSLPIKLSHNGLAMAPHSFLDHTQRRTTVGITPLDERPARRRDLYLTTHNNHSYHAAGGIRNHDSSRRAAADLRLRPRGHWDRRICIKLYLAAENCAILSKKAKNLRQHCHAIYMDCCMPRNQYAETKQCLS